MKPLHLVDLDKTLVRVNLSFEFGKHLFKRGVFSFFQVVQFLIFHVAHLYFNLPIKTLHQRAFKALFKGMKRDFFAEMSKEWVAIYVPKVLNVSLYDYLLEKQKAAEKVVLCSSSPEFLVEAVADYLGIACSIGTQYDLDKEGRMVGILRIIDGEQKAIECENEEESYVYTDSVHDLSALEACNYPIGVNPDRELRKICLQRKWKILD